MMKIIKPVHTFFVIMIISLCLASCSNNDKTYKALQLTNSETCGLCGMIILNYAGPHAQIAWKDGKHTFYCNILEAFPIILDTAQRQRMGEIFVQDFGGIKWASYSDKWIKAKNAYYVIDSHRLSVMGITYVPFKNKNQAIKFQKQFGGQVVSFNQITNNTISYSYSLMQKKQQEYGPHMSSMDM